MQSDSGKAPFTACSKFWPRYKASGATVNEAYSNYLKTTEEPENWRGVADELFRGISTYNSCLFKSDEGNPMSFWNELVALVLPQAYGPPVDKELAHRLYAYSEWCRTQVQPEPFDGEPAEHLRTCVSICFYEAMPRSPLVLADMPNWFAYSEVDEFMLQNPFMADDVNAIKAAFGVV